MMQEIRRLIEVTLSIIDDYNAATEGKANVSKHYHELIGMKMILSCMGFHLDIDVNPFYYRDKTPSTYTLKEEVN
jgi:hypothetical protein